MVNNASFQPFRLPLNFQEKLVGEGNLLLYGAQFLDLVLFLSGQMLVPVALDIEEFLELLDLLLPVGIVIGDDGHRQKQNKYHRFREICHTLRYFLVAINDPSIPNSRPDRMNAVISYIFRNLRSEMFPEK